MSASRYYSTLKICKAYDTYVGDDKKLIMSQCREKSRWFGFTDFGILVASCDRHRERLSEPKPLDIVKCNICNVAYVWGRESPVCAKNDMGEHDFKLIQSVSERALSAQ